MSEILLISAYNDDKQKVRWRATDETKAILARCPTGYDSPDDMIQDLRLLLTSGEEPLLYKDKGKKWRWSLSVATAQEHKTKIAAVAARGYSKKSDCIAASKLFLEVESFPR